MLWVGRTLAERWHLEGLVGLGGVAAVYRARDVGTGRLAALKLLMPVHAAETARRRFVREARIANKVPSASVLEVIDSGEAPNGTPFLVTKLLEGETLEQTRLASGGALPLPEVVAVGVHVLRVLEAAHGEGIVHRDIKPANLFRSRQGMVYVLDFGLARAFEERDEDSPISSMSTPLGTLGFMAPEQAQGRWDLVGPQTDLFAVGATLLKLATGLDLYDAPDPHERFLLSTSKPVPPLASRGASLPPALCDALDRSLRFAQRDRWASARDFRDALERWQTEVRGAARRDEPDQPARPAARTPRLSPRAQGAVLVLVAAALGTALGVGWIHRAARQGPAIQTVPGSGTIQRGARSR